MLRSPAGRTRDQDRPPHGDHLAGSQGRRPARADVVQPGPPRARRRRTIGTAQLGKAPALVADEAIDLHIQHGSALPTWQSAMHLYPINGAAGRVGQQDTAWSYRDATWGAVMVGVDPDPANAGLLKDWAIAYWEALHPYSAGGAYVNMMMDEATDRIRAAYRDNYDRLVAVKTRYDLRNLFHVNQNIKPTR